MANLLLWIPATLIGAIKYGYLLYRQGAYTYLYLHVYLYVYIHITCNLVIVIIYIYTLDVFHHNLPEIPSPCRLQGEEARGGGHAELRLRIDRDALVDAPRHGRNLGAKPRTFWKKTGSFCFRIQWNINGISMKYK